MQVDFYQLATDPVERAVAMIAARVLESGERLLVVAQDDALLARLSRGLWEARPTQFLANGRAGDGNEAHQPVLLSSALAPENGATCVVFADGIWREPEGGAFARAFLFFDAGTVDAARFLWRSLGQREGMTRRFWKQEAGRWVPAG